jgi:hypothetical protein
VIGGDIDLSGLAVITPNPALKLNQAGLPEKKAWELYEPFVVRQLIQKGMPATHAAKSVEKRDGLAYAALQEVVKQRPVILNRAPTLHKYSMMAFWPVLSKGDTLQISPTIVKPFGADYDGDLQIGKVFFKASLTKQGTCAILSSVVEKCPNKYTEMTDMFKETEIAMKAGDKVYLCDLQDFPHGEFRNRSETEKGPIDWYDALPETQVLAYNEKEARLEWADVLSWTVHPDREIEVVTLLSGRHILTDDDPRAVYGIDKEKLELSRFTPMDALNGQVMVPRYSRVEDLPELVTEIFTGTKLPETRRLALREYLPLNARLGYFLGVICGDGWVSGRDGAADITYVAGLDQDVFNEIDDTIGDFFLDERPKCTRHMFLKEEHDDRYGDCDRIAYASKEMGQWVRDTLGHRAANKHLPAYTFVAPREFRNALFSGLIDTDGTITFVKAKAKKNRQLMCGFTTTSIRLANEVSLLARSLGIRNKISPFTYRDDRQAWQVYFSSPDMIKWGGEHMKCGYKKANLQEAPMSEQTGKEEITRGDNVPYTEDVHALVSPLVVGWYKKESGLSSVYTELYRSFKESNMTRAAAKRIIENIGDVLDEYPVWNAWKAIVANADITWDRVASVEKTGMVETGYDLCVPGYETFMSVDGVVLSNTMSYSVPVSQKAVQEAVEKMMPEKNLLYVRDRGPTYVPSSEYLQGLYLGTRRPKDKAPKVFSSKEEAMQAYRSGEIAVDDPIVIR